MSGVDQFPAETPDTHERQRDTLRRSGDPEAGYCRAQQSSLPPVWEHAGEDDVHRQDLLRPEGHHRGGRPGGLQRVPGPGGPDRERGVPLRYHHPGLPRAEPAPEQVPASAGGPGFPM